MKKQTLSYPKQILMSLILASILLGFAPQRAQAQFTVFDPTQYTLQLAKKIEEAARWVETINHYVAMYEKAAQQYQKMVESVTNLRGILDKVDEQVMRHKQLITTYAQLGKLIRGTFRVKAANRKHNYESDSIGRQYLAPLASRHFRYGSEQARPGRFSAPFNRTTERTRNCKIWNGSPNSIPNWNECFTTAK